MISNNITDILTTIAQTIYDKKGFNILILDVRNISTMTDYFIIAEGTVDRHVKALSNAIVDQLQEKEQHLLRIEGKQSGEWIVLDYGDYVIHLLTPELREKYRIERVWHKADIVDVAIQTHQTQQKEQKV